MWPPLHCDPKIQYLHSDIPQHNAKKYAMSFCRKVVSSKTSRLVAHANFFRLLMKGIFDPYVL